MPKGNKLTKKEKAFADEYIKTGNGTQSALNVYDTDSYHTAWGIASNNIKKPKIRAYLDDKGDKAWEVIEELMCSEKEDIRLSSAKFIYEHVHWKATQKSISITKNVNVTEDMTNEQRKKIAMDIIEQDSHLTDKEKE